MLQISYSHKTIHFFYFLRTNRTNKINLTTEVIESVTEHDGTPDLSTYLELVNNGTLKRRLVPLLTLTGRPDVIDRRDVVPEIEIGYTLLTVQPAAPTGTTGTTQTTNGNESSLLLRAFRRQTASPIALIGNTERIDDWASPKVAHVARTLEGLGFVFQFQMMVSRVTDRVIGDGRHAVHRVHTHIRGCSAVQCSDMKLKEKVRIPIAEANSGHLQLALEWPVTVDAAGGGAAGSAGAGADPVLCALQRGFASMSHIDDTRSSIYAKCQWIGRCDQFPFEISLRLAFNLPLSDRLTTCRRPKNPNDLPVWLADVGCIGVAEWNVEIELLQPTDLDSIGKALFFFHIIRRQHEGTKFMSRTLLKTIVTRDCQYDPKLVEIQYARLLLQHACAMGGIRCPDYPHQPRPHDFTLRDLDRHPVVSMIESHRNSRRLPRTFVTPKVDGRECFLVCHRTGAVILHRNGDAMTIRWKEGTVGIYPIILSFSSLAYVYVYICTYGHT